MKKIIFLVVSAVLIVALSGDTFGIRMGIVDDVPERSSAQSTDSVDVEPETEPEPATEPAPATTETPTETPTSEPVTEMPTETESETEPATEPVTETTAPETTATETESTAPETEGKPKSPYGEITYWGKYSDEQIKTLKEIEDLIAFYHLPISVMGITLDGWNTFSYNAYQTYFSACTIKAPYVLSVLKYMEKNGISLDTKLKYEKKHFLEGTGNIQYSSFGTEYTIRYLINQALSISDNVAYNMLNDHFGNQIHDEYMIELGCPSLVLVPAGIWAVNSNVRDFAVCWQEICRYFDTGSEYAMCMKDACTNTGYNYACLNMTEWSYSHKSGDNYDETPRDAHNDVCVIWKERPYILAIFSEADYRDSQTCDIITQIANKVHYSLWP